MHHAGAAGVLKTILLYPMELAYTRLAADATPKGQPGHYFGLLHCMVQVSRFCLKAMRGSTCLCLGPVKVGTAYDLCLLHCMDMVCRFLHVAVCSEVP